MVWRGSRSWTCQPSSGALVNPLFVALPGNSHHTAPRATAHAGGGLPGSLGWTAQDLTGQPSRPKPAGRASAGPTASTRPSGGPAPPALSMNERRAPAVRTCAGVPWCCRLTAAASAARSTSRRFLPHVPRMATPRSPAPSFHTAAAAAAARIGAHPGVPHPPLGLRRHGGGGGRNGLIPERKARTRGYDWQEGRRWKFDTETYVKVGYSLSTSLGVREGLASGDRGVSTGANEGVPTPAEAAATRTPPRGAQARVDGGRVRGRERTRDGGVAAGAPRARTSADPGGGRRLGRPHSGPARLLPGPARAPLLLSSCRLSAMEQSSSYGAQWRPSTQGSAGTRSSSSARSSFGSAGSQSFSKPIRGEQGPSLAWQGWPRLARSAVGGSTRPRRPAAGKSEAGRPPQLREGGGALSPGEGGGFLAGWSCRLGARLDVSELCLCRISRFFRISTEKILDP